MPRKDLDERRLRAFPEEIPVVAPVIGLVADAVGRDDGVVGVQYPVAKFDDNTTWSPYLRL